MNPGQPVVDRAPQIKATAARHGVGAVYVFGSAARGTATDSSDLDLHIDVTGPVTPWFPGRLIAELETLLGCRVDVVERRALRPELRDAILRETLPL